MLNNHSLDHWYPESVDVEYGGFITHFSHDWQPDPEQRKMVVSQSRLIWTASVASEFYPDNDKLLTSAAHGVDFLKTKMWDVEFGGFYDGGYYYSEEENLTIRRNTKTWWAQAEGLTSISHQEI